MSGKKRLPKIRQAQSGPGPDSRGQANYVRPRRAGRVHIVAVPRARAARPCADPRKQPSGSQVSGECVRERPRSDHRGLARSATARSGISSALVPGDVLDNRATGLNAGMLHYVNLVGGDAAMRAGQAGPTARPIRARWRWRAPSAHDRRARCSATTTRRTGPACVISFMCRTLAAPTCSRSSRWMRPAAACARLRHRLGLFGTAAAGRGDGPGWAKPRPAPAQATRWGEIVDQGRFAGGAGLPWQARDRDLGTFVAPALACKPAEHAPEWWAAGRA